jgi:cytochrome c-type biogenesis protein CcmH
MLWFALAVMTGLAVLAALWPLAFRRAPGREAASEAAFYKAQLDEIDRDVERGQLPRPEASSARAEAARRLIAASANEASAATATESVPRRRAAAAFIFVVVPLVALGAYFWAGRPDLPDAPLASRETDANSPDAMDAAIAKIEGHLAATPDDAKGWSVLAPVYMRMGRYDDAAGAFRQLLRLQGENGELRADYGEALVAAGGAIVTADARAAFEKALSDTPGLPKARFYIALAAEQDGETKNAIEQYQSLVNDAKGDESWKPAVAARLAALKGEHAPSAAPPSQASAGVEGMSADQQQMVRGMVERLATRLAQSGGSAEEWARLIRAYSVLHETDKARETLVAARAALGNDSAAVANLDTLARDLGLAQGTP